MREHCAELWSRWSDCLSLISMRFVWEISLKLMHNHRSSYSTVKRYTAFASKMHLKNSLTFEAIDTFTLSEGAIVSGDRRIPSLLTVIYQRFNYKQLWLCRRRFFIFIVRRERESLSLNQETNKLARWCAKKQSLFLLSLLGSELTVINPRALECNHRFALLSPEFSAEYNMRDKKQSKKFIDLSTSSAARDFLSFNWIEKSAKVLIKSLGRRWGKKTKRHRTPSRCRFRWSSSIRTTTTSDLCTGNQQGVVKLWNFSARFLLVLWVLQKNIIHVMCSTFFPPISAERPRQSSKVFKHNELSLSLPSNVSSANQPTPFGFE